MSLRASTPVVAAVCGAIAVAFACLPDLEIAPASPACGNGVVDLDLGEQCDPGDAGPQAPCSQDCTQVLCDGGFVDPQSNHCYFWAGPTSTLTLAEQGCQTSGASVVTFASFDELVFVTGRAEKAVGAPPDGGNFRPWCALQRGVPNDAGTQTFTENGEPGWSRDCPGCYAHLDASAMEFPILPEGGVQENCVMWSAKATVAPWYTTTCDLGVVTKRPVLCEREPLGSFTHRLDPTYPKCAKDPCIVVRYTLGQKIYALMLTPASASDAESACEQRGGQLATFDSSEEREQVTGELARASVSEAWIGVSPDAGYAPWGDLEPSSTGAPFVRIDRNAYDTRLAHADDGTGTLRPFVCELTP